MLGLCEQCIGDSLNSRQKSIIDRCVRKLYIDIARSKEKYIPVMSDFYDILMAQPEDEAKDIALSLELFVNGSLNIFNHQTNVDVDNRFTVYGIRDLGTELSPITMLVMMESIQNRIVENGKRGKAILGGITDSRQKTVCSYALHRVGFPYSQDLRDSGNYYDCSSLAYYSWKDAGMDISHGGATTAAAEAQGLDEAGKTVSFDELQPGDLIFYSFTSNGRYKNISHVAVYVGNGKVVEALNENLGVVYRDVASTGKIVVIGRP